MQSNRPNRKNPPILNDNISRLLRSGDFVPKNFVGSDRFLDIISWNIKFFNDRDRSRLDLIVVSSSVPEADIQQTASVVNWNVLLEKGSSAQTKATLESLIENISDHLPVLARFYFSDTD